MKELIYFKSFKKFAIGYHRSTIGLWWHNIKPRLINNKKYKSMRHDTFLSLTRTYFRDSEVYVYNITIFSHIIAIGPVKRRIK